jgi:hypothetical protein
MLKVPPFDEKTAPRTLKSCSFPVFAKNPLFQLFRDFCLKKQKNVEAQKVFWRFSFFTDAPAS